MIFWNLLLTNNKVNSGFITLQFNLISTNNNLSLLTVSIIFHCDQNNIRHFLKKCITYLPFS